MHKVLGKIINPGAKGLTSRFLSARSLTNPTFRFFSQSNSTPNQEEQESTIINHQTTEVVKAHSFFNDKNGTITFVVDYPLFPMSKYVISLNDAKFQVSRLILLSDLLGICQGSTKIRCHSC